MKKVILLILSVSFPAWLGAQATLQQCREKARQHYPAIRQYSLVEQSKALTLANASQAWLPQVVLGAQASWQNAVSEFPQAISAIAAAQGMEIPGMRKDQYQVSVQVEQPVWDGGLSRAQRGLSQAQASEQALQADVDMYALESRIDELYFGILMLDSRIAQAESMIALLEGNWEQAKAMVRGGAALQSDADAIEAELLSAGQSLASLRSARAAYRQVMELFIGEPLPDGLERPGMPVRLAFSRPELSLMDAKITSLEAQENLVKVSARPRLGLYAQGWYGYPGLDMFRSMASAAWTWNAIIGVRAVWNVTSLFTMGNRLGRLRNAKTQVLVQKDIFTFNTALQDIGYDADMARLQGVEAEDGRILELRRGIRAAAEAKYRSGTITASELLKAISDETAAAASAEGHSLELLKTAYHSMHNHSEL